MLLNVHRVATKAIEVVDNKRGGAVVAYRVLLVHKVQACTVSISFLSVLDL